MKLYQIQIFDALKYSSNLPIRLVLAMTSLLFSMALALGPPMLDTSRYYSVMFQGAPRWVWALVFALNSAGLWWRIISYKSRTGWSRVINSWTFGLYMTVVYTSSLGVGYFLPGNSAELMLCIMALWTALRTDFTEADRDTA